MLFLAGSLTNRTTQSIQESSYKTVSHSFVYNLETFLPILGTIIYSKLQLQRQQNQSRHHLGDEELKPVWLDRDTASCMFCEEL